MLELEELLAPLGQGAPAGADLRDSPAYAELERAVEGKPERQAGTKIVPAEPPDWKDIRTRCVAILKVSKDLRAAILLSRALLEVDGFAGFDEGLRLILGLVEGFWDNLHPQLDADEGADATARVSAMTELTQRGVIQALRAAPLATVGPLPPVSLRSIELAAVVRPPPAPPKPGAPAPAAAAAAATATSSAPSAASIDAVFQQVPFDALAKVGAAVARCSQSAQQITILWADRLPGAGPDFTELRRVLYQADQTLKTRLEVRGAGGGGAEKPGASAGGAGGGGAGAAPAAATKDGGGPAQPAAPPAFSGEIHSREDVLRSIDAICAYYARSEPGSPVPLILQRGKRLVTMSFGEILKELLPESVPNMQKISGKTD